MNQRAVWILVLLAVSAPAFLGCQSRRRARPSYAQRSTMSAPQASAPYYPTSPVPPAPGYSTADSGFSAPQPGGFSDAATPELDQARAEAERLRQEKAALESAIAEARARAEQAEAEMASLPVGGALGGGEGGAPSSGALVQIESDLRTQSGVEVIREGNAVVLRLTDAFEAGRDTLRSDPRLGQAIQAAAGTISRYPGARVSVVGHTDSSPIVKTKHLWNSNHHLSEARAQRVASMLSQQGIPSAQIVVVEGRGASDPLVVPERTRQDRARNRRVDIQISL